MERSMKAVLFLLFVFLLFFLSGQIFAQEIQADRAVSSIKMAELEKEFTEVREMLLSFRDYFNQKLSGFKLKKGQYFNGNLFWDNLGTAQKKIAKLDEAYINLLDKTYSYADYILNEEGNTALKRLTYKYLGTPGVTVKNYHLQEGAILEKIRDVLNELDKTWFSAKSYEEIFRTVKNREKIINDLVTALDTRLTEVEGVFNRSLERNNAIYYDNMQEIIEKHITRDNVLNYTFKVISQEDREAIGLLIKKNNLEVSKLELAAGIRKYLIKNGYKNVSPVFKLLKAGVLETWEAKEFETIINSKYANLMEDFPLIRNGRYVSPEYTIRRIMRLPPLMVLGAVLTAGAITEIKSNNRFSRGSVNVRMMKELKEKIENGEASLTETAVYYSDESSSSVVSKDANHLINAINLALAVKQANEDFDIISRSIQTEVGKKYVTVSEEEIENSFNIFYDKAIQRVEDGLI